jgi:hypothetical protein
MGIKSFSARPEYSLGFDVYAVNSDAIKFKPAFLNSMFIPFSIIFRHSSSQRTAKVVLNVFRLLSLLIMNYFQLVCFKCVCFTFHSGQSLISE